MPQRVRRSVYDSVRDSGSSSSGMGRSGLLKFG